MTSPAAPRTGLARWGGGLGLLLVLGWALRGSQVGPALGSVDGFEGTRVLSGLLHPQLSGALLGDVGRAAAQTLEIAIAGLLLSTVLAAPMALLLSSAAGGARLPRLLARLLATLLRGVPELIWALVLVTVVGLGPAAGTLAVALHGAGLLAKLWSEQLDGVDPRPVEAVRLTGASHAATLALAVVPQARPGLLSLLLYQLECNVRTATVLGFVGAGGIGQAIDLALRLFDYGQLGTLVIAVLVLVLGVDALSRTARRRLGGLEVPV